MLFPTFPRLSVTLKVKCPMPEPMAGVSCKLPFQLVPDPVSVTATGAPIGGPKLRVGVVPACGGLVNCRLTAMVGLLVVWIGGSGAVLIKPAGGVTSMINDGPEGDPLK